MDNDGPEMGIEAARAKLGDIVSRAEYGARVTYLTRNGRRVAAVGPLDSTVTGDYAAAGRVIIGLKGYRQLRGAFAARDAAAPGSAEWDRANWDITGAAAYLLGELETLAGAQDRSAGEGQAVPEPPGGEDLGPDEDGAPAGSFAPVEFPAERPALALVDSAAADRPGGVIAEPSAEPRPARRRREPKLPRITERTEYELAKAPGYAESRTWLVMIDGIQAGQVRPAYEGTGSSPVWEAVTNTGARARCLGKGATPRGNARTRDKAAAELLGMLIRGQAARR